MCYMERIKKCNGCGKELGEFEGHIFSNGYGSVLGGYDNYCDNCYEEMTGYTNIKKETE